jgi:hypothetical protein
MTDTLSEFAKIVPFLTQPLVLVGFVMMLVFYIHKQLLKSGIIPKVNEEQGGYLVTLLLRYGFVLGVLILLLGFGLKAYELYTNSESKAQTIEVLQAFQRQQQINTKPSKDRWKTSDLQEITLGLSKEYVRDKIGIPKVSINLSKTYPNIFKFVELERYEDKDGEVQTLYNDDNQLVGLVIRQFADDNSRIIRSPNLRYPIWALHKEWVFGKDTFNQLESEPGETIEDSFRKSVCQVEKHYFGAPGGYNDYYFSVWLTDDTEESKKPGSRIPNSLLIVSADKVCLEEGNACDKVLQMLACTWGSDFAD